MSAGLGPKLDGREYAAKAATLHTAEELDGWAEGIRLCPQVDDAERWAALARRRAELGRLKR